jgi:hypothetical protein
VGPAWSRLAVGQAIVFRGLPSSSTATPGTGTVQLICGHYTRL